MRALKEETENFIHDKYGYCYYAIYRDKNPLIFNLFTEYEYRNKGYAKKHLTYIINEIRQTGYVGEIEIEARPKEIDINHEKLRQFYTKMGLKTI